MPLHVIWLAIMLACIGYVPARAEAPICMPTADLRGHLAKKYGETLVSSGLDNRGIVMEVWGNPVTESWSLLFTQADGVSCLVAAGQGLLMVPPGDPA